MGALVQIALAVFGLSALFMALSNSARARFVAPFIGLFLAEPAWLYYSINAQAWGIVVLGAAYSAVYAWGIFVQLKGRK